jgi:hydrogenase 3 maturation protease
VETNELYAFLKEHFGAAHRLAILGAGSVLKADDAAGVRVAEALQAALTPERCPNLLLCAGETAPENFSGKIKGFAPTHLLVLDAADLGRAPGAIVEIQPKDVGGPRTVRTCCLCG